MNYDRVIREPKQTRSIKMKNDIIQSAYNLICKKGYYKTTTNEIAKSAGVSIGSLYSYFSGKDEIFFEILDDYLKGFSGVFDNAEISLNKDLYNKDKKLWIKNLLNHLISLHESNKEFSRELNSLCFTKPEVKKVLDDCKEKGQKATFKYFNAHKDDFNLVDVEASVIVVMTLFSAVVDTIVFDENAIERERIIDVTVNAAYNLFTYGVTV